MRRFPFALVVLLAACDSAAVLEDGPDADAIVGTWTVTEQTSETLVRSRVDQSVPDFEVEGTGGIEVSGALEDRLTYVSSLYRYSVAVQGVEAQSITFVSRPGFDLEDGPYTIFRADSSANGPEAVLNRVTLGAETYYDGRFPRGTSAFTYRDGRLTVPPVTVTAEDGSGRQITVGGTLTFPVVSLRAGQETVLHTETGAVEGEWTVTFSQDGVYRQTGSDWTTAGRWRRDTDGTIVVQTGTVSTRYQADLEGGSLRLRSEEPAGGAGCVEECVQSVAANLFAPPTSIESVRYASTAVYRRQVGA